jgi:hypothetical protein
MTLFDLSEVSGSEPGPHRPHDHDADAVTTERAHTGEQPTEAHTVEAQTVEAHGVEAHGVEALPEVEVRISARRKKTSEARWVGGRIVVSLPAHLDVESRQKTIDWLVNRLLTRHRLDGPPGDDELLARAVALSERYRLGARPVSVRWVTNQTARWASCSYYSGEIRVSHRLRAVPDWVLDSVLVHEVAHLVYPDHSPAFHRLAGAYPRHEEAGMFLAGYGLGLSTDTR